MLSLSQTLTIVELSLAMAELKRASFCSFGLRKTFKSKVEKWKSGKLRQFLQNLAIGTIA